MGKRLMLKNNKLLVLLFLVTFMLPATARPAMQIFYGAKVMHICNANTIIVNDLYTHELETVIIAGTIAPTNFNQDDNGKRYLTTMILGQEVDVLSYGHDKYGRVVADLKDHRNLWISYDLIAGGFVYWNRSLGYDYTAEHCENFARKHHSGVWR